MTDPRTALLAAIRANPADDLPRLAYADLLDDTGHPADAARAEFIRLQLRQESLVHPADWWLDRPMEGRPAGPERAAIEARLDQLYDAHAADWLGDPVPVGMRGRECWRGCFRRGFVRFVSCFVGDLPGDADRVFAREPADGLDLGFDWEDGRRWDDPTAATAVAAVAGEPFWSQVRRLRFDGCCGQDGDAALLAPLLATPAVAGLEDLDAAGLFPYDGTDYTPGDRFAAALAASPHLGRLQSLTLPDRSGDDELLPVLAGRLPALRRLTLQQPYLSAAVAGPLAGSPLVARLTHLSVTSPRPWEAWAEVLAALLRSPALRNLVHLDVSYAGYPGGELVALANCPHLQGLRELRLRCCLDAGDDWLPAVARSPHLARLRWLDLSDNPLTDRDADTLAGSAFAPTLGELTVSREHQGQAVPLDRLQAGFGDRLRVRG